jgi:hypothetical protein
MEAKVKDNARFKKYNLFDSNEFFKGEWRPVPAGFEEQARAEKLLDIREDVSELPEIKTTAYDLNSDKLPTVILPAETYEYMQDETEIPKKKYQSKLGSRKRKDESGEFASSEAEA